MKTIFATNGGQDQQTTTDNSELATKAKREHSRNDRPVLGWLGEQDIFKQIPTEHILFVKHKTIPLEEILTAKLKHEE